MKKILYGISVAALFLIPIFPLIVANSYFFPFITGKAFYFRILVEIAFVAWLILAFIEPKYRSKLTSLNVAVTLFALIALIADLLGVNPLRSLWSNFERMEGWITIIHLWAFYVVTSSILGTNGSTDKTAKNVAKNGTAYVSRTMWHRWLNASLVIGTIVAFYGVFQLLGWAATHQGSRVDASLGNAAYMAVYMLFNAGLAAYMFFVAYRRKMAGWVFLRWAYPVLFILFSFILFETATRGTILGLVGGIMLACAVYAIFGKNESKRARAVSASAIGLIFLLGLILWLGRGSSFVEKSEVLNRLASISWNDSNGQARQLIWPLAVKGALARPIYGWGQENFNYIFNGYYDARLWSQEQWFDRAHSVFLDWLVASGVVGLLAYLSLYAFFLVAVWRSQLSMAEKSVLTGLLAGYAVHNIFVFDNLASYVLFFAFLGFVNSLNEGKPIRWLGTKPLRTDAVEYIVAPIVVVALVLVLYFFEVRPIEANTRLITALESCAGQTPDVSVFDSALSVNTYVANQEIREQTLSCAGQIITNQQAPGPTKQAFFTLAMNAIQDQIAATPKVARIYTLGGSFLTSVGQFPQAVQLLEKAHQLSPEKQSIDLELANGYLNTGKTPQAVALLKHAYESTPDDGQINSAYAVALVLSGKEADAHLLFGDDPKIFGTVQMASVYASLKQYQKAIAIYEDLLKANPTDVNTNAQLAQLQYAAGMTSASIATMRGIEKDHPELKDQIEAAIKQVQTQVQK
jgi:tetratricopeptide (TPR) repeat protein